MKQVLLWLLVWPLLAHAEDTGPEAVCRGRLTRLGAAVRAYRMIHDNKDPANLSDLYYEGLVDDLADFSCPASATKITARTEIDSKTDYTLQSVPEVKDLVVREKKPHHASDKILAALADGTVKLVAAPADQTAAATPPNPTTTPSPARAPAPIPDTTTTSPEPAPPEATPDTTRPTPPPFPPGPTPETTGPTPAPLSPGPETMMPTPPVVPAPSSVAPALPSRAQAQGYIGVKVRTLANGATGIFVEEVVPGGPAAVDGGLRKGDVIVTMNGEAVVDAGHLVQKAEQIGPGARLNFVVVRDGQPRQVSFLTGTRPAVTPRPTPPQALPVTPASAPAAPATPSPNVGPAAPLTPGPSVTPGPATDEALQMLARANELSNKGDFSTAVPLLQRAVRARPNDPAAQISLGRAYDSTGNLDGAIWAYQAAYRLSPQTPNLRCWIGQVYLHMGDTQSARRWLNDEIAANPKSAWAHSLMGTLYLQTGDAAHRDQAFRTAMTLDPNTAQYRYQNGQALYNQRQYQRALIEFVSTTYLNPGFASPVYSIAACYAALGQKAAAVQYYQRYLQLDGTSAWAAQARQEIQRLTR